MTLGSCDLDRREEFRRTWRQRRDCRFIDVADFEALIVSPKRLERCDDKRANLRGLYDPQSGLCYMIEMEKIHRPRPSYLRATRA